MYTTITNVCKLSLLEVIFLQKLAMQRKNEGTFEIFVDGKISQILILAREKVQFSAFKTSE